MRGRKIHVAILHNLRLETRCVTEPDLPFACAGLDSEPTWIDLGIVDHLAAKWTRTVERYLFWRGLTHLTKLRSATAGEGAHGGGRKGWSHGKLVCTPASGWLHRLLRLFVIHAFDRRDCRLDGDWIKCK